MTLEVLAFDMYGTLVNPIRIWKQLERYLPQDAQRIAETWRQKQLEYSFRLTAMERYEDFEQVTRKALDYALASVKQQLSAEQKQHLMQQYNDLERFPDVQSGLERLRTKGHMMVVFSNGTPAMLSATMQSASLTPYFQGFISVHDTRCYKPSPKVYRYLADQLMRPVDEIRLISSNPFDILGALNAGLQATWLDRTHGLFDTLGDPPPSVITTLEELADLGH